MISNGVRVDLTPDGPGYCNDREKNGDETDIDCGGRCSQKCDGGKDCRDGKDCKSDLCTKGLCVTGTDGGGTDLVVIPDPTQPKKVVKDPGDKEKTSKGADPDPEDGNRLFYHILVAAGTGSYFWGVGIHTQGKTASADAGIHGKEHSRAPE